VRRRREADDEEPRVGIAEARHRPAPVRDGPEAGDPLPRHLLAVRDEARAEPAADEAALESLERATRRRGRRR
jgi:hypothetical protein